METAARQDRVDPGAAEIAAIQASTPELMGTVWKYAAVGFAEMWIAGEIMQSLVLDYGALGEARIAWAENWDKFDRLAAIVWEKSGVPSVVAIGWDLCVRVQVVEEGDLVSFPRETAIGCRNAGCGGQAIVPSDVENRPRKAG